MISTAKSRTLCLRLRCLWSIAQNSHDKQPEEAGKREKKNKIKKKMNNFGVIELASTKTSHAPGWAYVPDVAHTPSTTIVPGNRKRAARNQAAASGTDLSARFDAKIRKEIESLDRDNARDVSIVVPGKANKGMASFRRCVVLVLVACH